MGKKKKETTTSPLLYLTTGAVVLLGLDYLKTKNLAGETKQTADETRKMANETERNQNISSYNSRMMNENVERVVAFLDNIEEDLAYIRDHAADVDDLNKLKNNQELVANKLKDAYKDLADTVSMIRKSYVSREDYEDISKQIGKLTDQLSDIKKSLPQK